MRRAYCDRARHLGDPDFVKIAPHLTTKEYARRLARSIDPNRATPSKDLAREIPLAGEGEDTTHFSVIDKDGMAVANTYTLEESFGSRVVVRGAGFLLNNEMGDFNWRPGHTDRRGRIGTEPNLVAPGKRMLSSQTPTVVAKGGKAVLITGSPGGRTIINTVLCVVLNVLEFDMDLRAAVDAPRFHHPWLPDRVTFEPEAHQKHAAALQKLRAMGHAINPKASRQGDAHSIWVDLRQGKRYGAVDPRRGGKAAEE
jgi:gamma-glutamyltranspeptidase/glutathione hydrolase